MALLVLPGSSFSWFNSGTISLPSSAGCSNSAVWFNTTTNNKFCTKRNHICKTWLFPPPFYHVLLFIFSNPYESKTTQGQKHKLKHVCIHKPQPSWVCAAPRSCWVYGCKIATPQLSPCWAPPDSCETVPESRPPAAPDGNMTITVCILDLSVSPLCM